MDSSLMDNLPRILGVGSMFAVAGGSLFSWIKGIPQKLYQICLDQFTVRVTIRDTDPLFPSILTFFNKATYTQKLKRFLAECVDNQTYGFTASLDRKTLKSGIQLSRAPGSHLVWYKNSMVFFERFVDEKKTGVSRPVETITLRTIGRSDIILRSLMMEAKEEVENDCSKYLDIRTSDKDGNWRHIRGCRKRELSTVILPLGVLEHIVSDLQNFMGSSEFYYSTGTPYHRGYLLEGPPGGGKSSLVQSLSTHFGFPLYVLNLNGINSDEKLRSLFREIPTKSLLLIEDIDTVAPSVSRDKTEESIEQDKMLGITLGGLLNVLDGIFSADGLVVFMTTNHPQKLDPALIRPGRIDKRIQLDYATAEQAKRLYHKFYATWDGADEFSQQTVKQNKSMAELQEQLVSKTLGRV